jgi:hypothetical protein
MPYFGIVEHVVMVCCFVITQLHKEEFDDLDKSKAMAMVFFSLLLCAETPPPRFILFSSIIAFRKWCLVVTFLLVWVFLIF